MTNNQPTMPSPEPVTERMQRLILQWEAASDDKALFLSCYRMMTRNMLGAVRRGEFLDAGWVERLLHRFADYYFVALEAYEREPASSPVVWQRAHDCCCDRGVTALQKILLGINAHINYDLVFTLDDMLRPEWTALSQPQRAARYADHCRVNEVIGRTIDAVQDHVLEPAMPVMDYIDRWLGPIDEMLISGLIARWREAVWSNALRLVGTNDEQLRAQLIRELEEETLKKAEFIGWREASS